MQMIGVDAVLFVGMVDEKLAFINSPNSFLRRAFEYAKLS
jgi:hypothetical protein